MPAKEQRPILRVPFLKRAPDAPDFKEVLRAPDANFIASIDIEIEILLADRFVGAVFADFLDRRIELLAQIIVALTQCDRNLRFRTRNITKELAAICTLLFSQSAAMNLSAAKGVEAAAFEVGIGFVSGRVELHVRARLAVNVIGIIALRGASLRTDHLACKCGRLKRDDIRSFGTTTASGVV